MQEHQRNFEKHWVRESFVAFSFDCCKILQIQTSDSASFFAPMSKRDAQYYAAGTNPQPSWLVAESELNGFKRGRCCVSEICLPPKRESIPK